MAKEIIRSKIWWNHRPLWCVSKINLVVL